MVFFVQVQYAGRLGEIGLRVRPSISHKLHTILLHWEVIFFPLVVALTICEELKYAVFLVEPSAPTYDVIASSIEPPSYAVATSCDASTSLNNSHLVEPPAYEESHDATKKT